MHPPHEHPSAQGLAHDLQTLVRCSPRRQALRSLLGFGAAAALPLLGCGGGGADAGGSSSASGGTSGNGSCSAVPEETAGPYPGDGSNSASGGLANALALSGIVRSDIRSSIAGASGTAAGVPLTLTLTLLASGASCAALSGYAVYLWHCDAQGRYSMYSSGVTAENYLRGVQTTDGSGNVTFQTIVPGCYAGRVPHMHFEIYPSVTAASSYANKIKTSQLAFASDVMSAVYAGSSLYSASVANLAAISFASDNVFSDGYDLQLATLTGSVAAGYTGTVAVAIAA